MRCNNRATGLHILAGLTLLVAFAGCSSGGDSHDQNSQQAEVNNPPAIVSAPERFVTENTSYVYQVRVADPEKDPIQYSLKTAPAGMAINADTGEISWTPASSQGGEHQVGVRASDGREADLQEFAIKVQTTKVVASVRVIATDGGILEVTDPSSPVFGSKIEIDAGVLPQDSTITISSASFPSYLPNRVPVLEIKSDLPPVATQKSTSSLQGLRSASIPGRTTVIMPFPPNLTTTEEENLKLYRAQYISFCRNTNIRQPTTNPFYCPHGVEPGSVWEVLDQTEYVKDRVARIFLYSLPPGTEAEALRQGNVLSISAMTPADKSSYQRRFVEIINPTSSSGKSGNLVLVHGVCSDSDQFRARDGLIDFVQNDGRSPYLNVFFYNYPWNEHIEYNGNELKRAIEELSQTGVISVDGTFDIIAHSMGGAVARWAIEDPRRLGSHLSPGVAHLFMLATPNWGVDSWFRDKPFCTEPGASWGEQGVEDTGPDDLVVGSTFLTDSTVGLNRAGVIERRGQTAYYLFTAKTAHQQQESELNQHRDLGVRWADHIGEILVEFDFVPVPNHEELKSLGLDVAQINSLPPNSALTFDGTDVGVRGTRYDHSTIHNECSWNLICEAIIRAVNYTPLTDSSFLLSVTINGNGTVSGGIECGGGVCSRSFSRGTILTLGAIAGDGWSFSGWSGACTGTSSCIITMDSEKAVTATFVMSDAPPDTTPPDTIAVVPANPTLHVGQIESFKVNVTLSDGFVGTLGLSGVIAAGETHTCVLITNGTVQCWGDNDNGELGNGSYTDSSVSVSVSGLTAAIAVTAGGSHTCALLLDGTVRCWGWNSAGQLGNGTTTDSSVPVVVGGITTAIAVKAGYGHNCALLRDGTVRCWGYNGNGELGNNTFVSYHSSTPVVVNGITAATDIAAGGFHTCVRLSDGTMQCWGHNNYGQLGNGTTVGSGTPVSVGGITTVAGMTAGLFHTCTQLIDATVQCWGRNDFGQLGNGAFTDSTIPVVVGGISSVAAMGAGDYHTCAGLSDGTVHCWGSNSSGQLGNGTRVDSAIPVLVSGVNAMASLAAGKFHTCVQLSDGTVRCWGGGSTSINISGVGVGIWSSSSLGVASMDANGYATCHNPGTTIITFMLEALSGSTSLTCEESVPNLVEI